MPSIADIAVFVASAKASGRSILVAEHRRLFRGGFEDVGREGCGGGLLGRVLLVRGVVAKACECVSRV